MYIIIPLSSILDGCFWLFGPFSSLQEQEKLTSLINFEDLNLVKISDLEFFPCEGFIPLRYCIF